MRRRRQRSQPATPARPTDRSLLVKVRTRARLHAHRRVRSILDGEHGSVHKGRSLDFDDLREYIPGDDVKDLDWKATARSGRPLVKRFVATRQHAVVLVVDTGRSMAGLADATSTKRDTAVLAAGVVAQLATRHGDLVGLIAGPVPARVATVGNDALARYVPPASGDAHLERLLRTIHDAIGADGHPSRLAELLEYAARTLRRRMILVIVADDIELDERHCAALRRLVAQHEVLHCSVGDVSIAEPGLRDRHLHVIGSGAAVPTYLRRHAALHDELVAAARSRAAALASTLHRLGITTTQLGGESTVVRAVSDLLERHRRSRPSGVRAR